jgi:hypothetical protein
MKLLDKYTLKINSPELEREYIAEHANRIFVTGVLLSLIRLILLIFTEFSQGDGYAPLSVKVEYNFLKWVTWGL